MECPMCIARKESEVSMLRQSRSSYLSSSVTFELESAEVSVALFIFLPVSSSPCVACDAKKAHDLEYQVTRANHAMPRQGPHAAQFIGGLSIVSNSGQLLEHEACLNCI